MNEALQCAQQPKNAREMVLGFHQNGRGTVSARLMATGSRLVGFALTGAAPGGAPHRGSRPSGERQPGLATPVGRCPRPETLVGLSAPYMTAGSTDRGSPARACR